MRHPPEGPLMNPDSEVRKRKQQIVTLSLLSAVLLTILSNPTIRAALRALYPSAPVRLGLAEIRIPKSWMLRTDAQRITAWKLCSTMLCSSSEASFVVEPTDLSEEQWERAARKVLHDQYSADAASRSINSTTGRIQCLELDGVIEDGRVLAACMSSELHVISTFVGKPGFRPAYYDVLSTAQKSL